MSTMTEKILEICEAECAFFGNGDKKEYQDSVYRRVGDYWSEVAKVPEYASWAGYSGKSGVIFKNGKLKANNNQPWSAAFISFVMSTAGAGSNFLYSPAHSRYIVKALDEAKKKTSTAGLIARRHKMYAPKLGDLIACERKAQIDPNFDTYKSYVSQGHYQAHCDFVTEIHDDYLVTIGGNVGNSVKRKRWPLDAKKMIGNHDPGNSSAGIICIIENRL